MRFWRPTPWALAGFLALSPLALAEDAAGQPRADGLFAMLDSNQDGEVARDEVPEPKQPLFDRLLREADDDDNGKLNSDEFAGGLALAPPNDGERPKDGDRPKDADRPRDGDRPRPGDRPDGPPGPPREGRGPQGPPPPEEIFKHIDSNGDGSISLDEFSQHHRQMMERFRGPNGQRGDFRPGRKGGPDRPRGERPDGPPRDGAGPPRGPRDGEGPPRGPQDRGPEGKRPEGERGPRHGNPEAFFSKMDKNGDGKLTADEAPEQNQERFQKMLGRNDKDGDKAVSKEEFMAGAKERMERAKERHGKPGGPEGRRRPGGPEGKPPAGPPPANRPGDDDDVRNETRPGSGRVALRAWLVATERRAAEPPKGQPGDRRPSAGPPHDRRPEGRGPRAGARPHGPSPAGAFVVFRLLNSNGDDKLSEAELKAAAEKLRRLDRDKDGNISAREMYAFASRGRAGAARPQGPPPGRHARHPGPSHVKGGWHHGPSHAGRGPKSMGELAGRENWDRGRSGPDYRHGHHGKRDGKHAAARHGHGKKHCHGKKCGQGKHGHGKAGALGKGRGYCPHCRRPLPGKGGDARGHKGHGKKFGHSGKPHGKKCHGKKCDGKKHHGKKCDGKRCDAGKSRQGKCRDGKCPVGLKGFDKQHAQGPRPGKQPGKHAGPPPWGRPGPGPRPGFGPQTGPRPGFMPGPMPGFDPGRMMEQMAKAVDENKDGKVSFDEFVAAHKKRFAELDANKDGAIDAAERKAAADKLAKRMSEAREKMKRRLQEMREKRAKSPPNTAEEESGKDGAKTPDQEPGKPAPEKQNAVSGDRPESMV